MSLRVRVALMSGLAAALAVACETSTSSRPVATVELTPGSLSLLVGDSARLTATPRDAAGRALSGRSVFWQSDAWRVATVSDAGLVTALAAGTATIIADVEGFSDSATVTVEPPVAGVTVWPGLPIAKPGDTLRLVGMGWDAAGRSLDGCTFTWTTGNPGVATVDAGGLLTAVAPGEAVITARSRGVPGTASLLVIPSTTTPSLSYWWARPGFGALVFRTGLTLPDSQMSISERGYRFRNWTCGTGTWDLLGGATGAVGRYADGAFTLVTLPWGDRLINPPEAGRVLTVRALRGLFDASDHALGYWSVESNDTVCSGRWEATRATALYLRLREADSLPYLTSQTPLLSNAAWIAGFAPGESRQWKAVLTGPITSDFYRISLLLDIATEGGPAAPFDVSLRVKRGTVEQELVAATFLVSWTKYFGGYGDVLQGNTGGAAGDTLILRVTYRGTAASGNGGLAFDNITVANSHVLVGGIVPVITPAARAPASGAPMMRVRASAAGALELGPGPRPTLPADGARPVGAPVRR